MTGKTWKQKIPRTQEHRDKLSRANTGRKPSQATIQKMSESKLGKPSATKGTHRINGKCYSREDYEKYCKEIGIVPKTKLNLADIEKKRADGLLWRQIAEEYGYNKETIRIWYKKNKN